MPNNIFKTITINKNEFRTYLLGLISLIFFFHFRLINISLDGFIDVSIKCTD